jgi:hypothetical protein
VTARVDETEADERVGREDELLQLSVLGANVAGSRKGAVVGTVCVDQTGIRRGSDGGLKWGQKSVTTESVEGRRSKTYTVIASSSVLGGDDNVARSVIPTGEVGGGEGREREKTTAKRRGRVSERSVDSVERTGGTNR